MRLRAGVLRLGTERRDGLRDIVTCLRSHSSKLYHAGFGGRVGGAHCRRPDGCDAGYVDDGAAALLQEVGAEGFASGENLGQIYVHDEAPF